MFENDLAELDAAGTLEAAEANEHTLTAAEIRRLQLAAHWADLHAGDAVAQSPIRGVERPVRLGGEGTPTVGDFAPAELGCVLGMSDGSASRLIADALDLRDRLPLSWNAVTAGQAPVYQARHIANTTRHLTADQADLVDAKIAPSLGAVSFGRLQTLVEAAIIEADPDGAERRAAAAAKERFVRLGRKSEHGLKLIIARATAGDAIWFKAAIDRIADILAREGDEDPIDVRRSKAIGIIAQPAEAVRLLCAHQSDAWDGPAEPDHREPAEQEADPDPSAAGGDDEAAADSDDLEPADDGTEPDQPATAGNDDAAESHPGAGTVPVHDQPAASEAAPSEKEAAHRSLKITPPPFNPDKARPRATVYVHLSVEALTAGTGICRIENVGTVLLSRLHMLLGERCTINLKPVIDLPAGHIPVDCYEIPANLREQLLLRYPADVFPYANTVSRAVDIDHTMRYLSMQQGGPPGQTRIGNLGPHSRYHHRVKTFGGWQVCQPEPGTWLWRSPHRWIHLVNATGTHRLGNTTFAEAIWRAAADPPHEDPPQELEANLDLVGSER